MPSDPGRWTMATGITPSRAHEGDSVGRDRIVAIVTGGDYPRAMLIDPAGKGWVIKRGDFVGRPEIVHTGGANGADYQLNWRVDRIREGDVVFIREDPGRPNIPATTRVIALRPEGDVPPARR